MINNMSFVYALSCDGNVFYIGKTKNLAARYKEHLNGTPLLKVHKYIKELLSLGKTPIMYPLDYLPNDKARMREAELIILFSKAGNILYNDVHIFKPSWPFQRLPGEITITSIEEFLITYQDNKETSFLYWQKNRQR